MMLIGELIPPTSASFGGHLVEGILVLREMNRPTGFHLCTAFSSSLTTFICVNL